MLVLSSTFCLGREFYSRDTVSVARDLVGSLLVRRLGEKDYLSGIIVETEAYGSTDDTASHAFRGITNRNRVMFGPVGRAYIYFTYGNHFCVNISARNETSLPAGAVLIRALQPLTGIDYMSRMRSTDNIFALASGPGKLTEAMGITLSHNGVDVTNPRSELYVSPGLEKSVTIATPRIGISREIDRKWRFVLLDPGNGSKSISAFASRKASFIK